MKRKAKIIKIAKNPIDKLDEYLVVFTGGPFGDNSKTVSYLTEEQAQALSDAWGKSDLG